MIKCLQYNGKSIRIRETTEMGGGIDGWFVYFDRPEAGYFYVNKSYYSTPEEEWAVLSDHGKIMFRNNVDSYAENQLDFLSIVVDHLTSGPFDRIDFSNFIKRKIEKLHFSSDELYKEMINSLDSEFLFKNTAMFSNKLEEIGELFELVEAVDNYDAYKEKEKKWLNWVCPEPTKSELEYFEKEKNNLLKNTGLTHA